MKIFTMIAGLILTILGVFCIAESGLSFLAVAFPVGLVMMFVGIVECFAYKKVAETEERKHFIFIDGLTTFFIGFVSISGCLTIDLAVVVAFALWSMVAGIRVIGLLIEDKSYKEEEKDLNFYCMVIVSALNLLLGIYGFFNSMLLEVTVLMMVGLCCAVQGLNVIRIGFDIPYIKPDLIKTKDEKIADAEAEVQKAKKVMKEAIQNVRDAKVAVAAAEEEPEFDELISEPAAEPISEIISNIVEPVPEDEEAAGEQTEEKTEE